MYIGHVTAIPGRPCSRREVVLRDFIGGGGLPLGEQSFNILCMKCLGEGGDLLGKHLLYTFWKLNRPSSQESLLGIPSGMAYNNSCRAPSSIASFQRRDLRKPVPVGERISQGGKSRALW